MKYLDTNHKRNSASITALIALILILLLFVSGLQYMDPPPEYGMAVNFGTTDLGSGNKPLSEPRKAIEEPVEEPPEEDEEEKDDAPEEDEGLDVEPDADEDVEEPVDEEEYLSD